jgi:two-component system response regulator YesN
MELLSQTDLSVKRISEICGFENQYYFSNFFKRRVGCAPSIYRENMLSIL